MKLYAIKGPDGELVLEEGACRSDEDLHQVAEQMTSAAPFGFKEGTYTVVPVRVVEVEE